MRAGVRDQRQGVHDIEHLLIHTAGIRRRGSAKDRGDGERRLERFAQWRPLTPPGEKFIYHIHANYWPIADAIQRITGKRLGEFVRERTAEPVDFPICNRTAS